MAKKTTRPEGAEDPIDPPTASLCKAQTKQLEKRIKKLEEELEDAEADLADAVKKLKNKTSELDQLDEKYQKQSDELNGKARALAQTQADLKIKMKSLGFVQEILAAKVTATQDMVRLNKDIDRFESFVKGPFIDLLSFLMEKELTLLKAEKKQKSDQQGLDEMKDQWAVTFDQWAATKRKSWLDGKTAIAFVGEFSAGKTTIVNRILSQDQSGAPQLPVDTEATTAIPTYIAGGRKSSYTFISNDTRKTIPASTFKSVTKQMLEEVGGVTSLIKYFVMTYKNPLLDGLSILDTPGFNSNDPEDAKRTIEVINECDALLWVFDVNVGEINKTSIKLIKGKLQKPLYVVINKVDTMSEADVSKVERQIKNTLKHEGVKIEGIIRFSDKAPIEDIMRPIQSVTRNASRDTFVQDLSSSIEEMIKIIKKRHKKLNNDVNRLDHNNEEMDNEIISCMERVVEECDEASGIPHWEEHFFSSDRYEMSAYEGKRMKDILDRVAENRVRRLRALFNRRIKNAHKFQQTYSDLCYAKEALLKATECLDEFNRVTKNFT